MNTHIAAAAITIPLAYQGPSETAWRWVSEVESDVWSRIAIVTDANDLAPLAEDDEWLVLVTSNRVHMIDVAFVNFRGLLKVGHVTQSQSFSRTVRKGRTRE